MFTFFFKLDRLGIIKITMNFRYGGGAWEGPLAPRLIGVHFQNIASESCKQSLKEETEKNAARNCCKF